MLVDVWCVYAVSGVFFLMIRRPPRSTQSRSSAASDVYKRQHLDVGKERPERLLAQLVLEEARQAQGHVGVGAGTVSYTHLRAHETVLDLVCRLLLEKKKQNGSTDKLSQPITQILSHTA